MTRYNYIKIYNYNSQLKELYNQLSDTQLINHIKTQTISFNEKKSGYIHLIVEATGEKYPTCQAWVKTNKGKNRMPLGAFILWSSFIGIDVEEHLKQFKN